MGSMTPRLGSALASAFALLLLVLAPATTHADTERVALVVDASVPASAVDGIKRELAKQAGVLVESLSAAVEGPALPRVTITVVTDQSGVLRVFYWDVSGHADALSVPAGGAQLELIVSTLAAALIRRQLPLLEQREQQRAANEACTSWETLVTLRPNWFPVHALPAVHLRTYPITTADF